MSIAFLFDDLLKTSEKKETRAKNVGIQADRGLIAREARFSIKDGKAFIAELGRDVRRIPPGKWLPRQTSRSEPSARRPGEEIGRDQQLVADTVVDPDPLLCRTLTDFVFEAQKVG